MEMHGIRLPWKDTITREIDMEFDFAELFAEYEKLLKQAESVFETVKMKNEAEVNCTVGCADCCHAVFDLTLIEALYINYHFHRLLDGEEKAAFLERANRSDRATHIIKKKAYKDLQSGRSEDEILEEMAEKRIRCPLLSEEKQCRLYHYRPLTCRFYGIPTAIGGKAHTCGLSGFVPGKQYPTVDLGKIQQQLYSLSAKAAEIVNSKYTSLAEMLVPLSMALLNTYDKEYLGVRDPGSDSGNKEE